MTVEDLLKIKPTLASRVTPKTADQGQLILKMEFGRSDILNKVDIKKIKNQVVVQIDLVYTSYQKLGQFDQPALNAKRLRSLQKLVPKFFESNLIEWQFIAQSSCTGDNCHKMFHGFIIHTATSTQSNYRPLFPKLERQEEIKLVQDYFGSNNIQSYPATTECDTVIHELDSLGLFIPVSKNKQARGLRYQKKGIWNRSQELVRYQRHEIRNCQDIASMNLKAVNIAKWTNDGHDAIVINTLANLDQRESYTIVQDVTKSMHPYSIQALYWHYHIEDTAVIENWVVFNDGNGGLDKTKKIGKTGGIYHLPKNKLDTLNLLIINAMNTGDGGDLPENDIEALVFAQSLNPQSELVLIADSFSNCRDFSLHPNLHSKLHIILCGAGDFINEEYIKLAIEHNGNIYTNSGVYRNMGQFKSGRPFQIGNRNFIYDNKKLKIIWS